MPPINREETDWYRENIEPHEKMLRAWLQGRFSLGLAIDDVVQEAVLRAIKARDRGVLYAPKAFLFTTARNLSIDHIRKKKRLSSEPLAKLDESNVIHLSDSVPEIVARNQEYAILKEAIASLPKKCREIFTMRRIYGMSQMEIAEVLGISRNTVSAQLTIGLRKCGEYFERYNEEGEKADAIR